MSFVYCVTLAAGTLQNVQVLRKRTMLLQAHNDLLRTYEAKLTQFGIPVEELGFQPLDTTVGGQTLGQGAAGLVSASS